MKESTEKTLSLPIAEVEVTALKDAITDKFGSLSQFARLTGRDRTEMAIRLNRNSQAAIEYQALMLQDAARICAQPLAPGYHITPLDRDKIKAALGRYSTITQFCKECKPKGGDAFNSVFISRVLNGVTGKITHRVKQLASVLDVELNAPV
jgi:hypothetical protein